MAGKKMPVSERALIKRVNRKLSEDGRKLMKNHPARSKKGRRRITDREDEFGTYFVVRLGMQAFDANGEADYASVAEHHVDLEELARRCGAISAFEFLKIEKTYGRK